MTHLLVWMILFPLVPALWQYIMTRAGERYEDTRPLGWASALLYVAGIILFTVAHYV